MDKTEAFYEAAAMDFRRRTFSGEFLQSGFGESMEGTLDQRVLKVISEQTGVPVTCMKGSDNLQADLGLDSLSTLQLQLTLEEEFGIEMETKLFRHVYTVGGLVAFVAREVK